MFKKMVASFMGLTLALPLLLGGSLSVSAAKAKNYKFSIITSDFYDTKRAYHLKNHSATFYRAAIGADNPSINFTAKGKLKSATTYYVDQYVKAQSNATKKNRGFLHVQGSGWVQQTSLVKGAYKE